jgi:hypothetical protein
MLREYINHFRDNKNKIKCCSRLLIYRTVQNKHTDVLIIFHVCYCLTLSEVYSKKGFYFLIAIVMEGF